jgi:CelD/BcsL family acetyltransferase involved in cellulose biosynthesis
MDRWDFKEEPSRRAQQIRLYDSVEAVSGKWLTLWSEAGRPPWCHPAWVERWWTAFGRGRLSIAAVHAANSLDALVAFEMIGGEIRTASNEESPGVPVLARNRSAAQSVWTALLQSRRINVFPIEVDDLLYPALCRSIAAARYSTLVKSVGASPLVELESWPRYESQLSSKLRRELRRRWRSLTRQAVVSLELYDGSSRVDLLLQRCLDLEAASWKGQAGTAIASRPDALAFYRSLASWAAREGWLRMAFLVVDGRPVAFDLSLEANRSHYLLKTSFDRTFARFAPGSLLRHAMIHRAFSVGLRRYEFLGRDDPWKMEWTKNTRNRLQVRAFPASAKGRLEHAAFAVARRMRTLRRRGAPQYVKGRVDKDA